MLEKYFGIHEKGSTISREILSGMTTFSAMAYIIAVNPGILQAAGLPKDASTIATCLAAAVGTLLMGFYAKRPLAIAPYMGENAFITFCVVGALGYTWQQGIAAILVGGVLFAILTFFRLRTYLANSISPGLRFSFVVGIGFFLAFIGLEKIGVVVNGAKGGPPVVFGDLGSTATLLGIGCFVCMAIFILYRIPSGIFLAIILTYVAGIILGIEKLPAEYIKLPDFSKFGKIASLWPLTDWKLDFSGFLHLQFIMAVFVPIFLMDFFDTIGTLIGVSARAGFLDENGNLPEIEKPMMCDALASIAGALFGTTTTGTYIESSTGIEAGGRTGLTSIVTGLLFLLALLFAPVFTAIPVYAYGSALIIIGLLMMQAVKKINLDDVTELVPTFSVIVLIPLTYNIGVGMAAGFVLYPVFKLLGGRHSEVSPGSIVFAVASIVFFIFFPYSG